MFAVVIEKIRDIKLSYLGHISCWKFVPLKCCSDGVNRAPSLSRKWDSVHMTNFLAPFKDRNCHSEKFHVNENSCTRLCLLFRNYPSSRDAEWSVQIRIFSARLPGSWHCCNETSPFGPSRLFTLTGNKFTLEMKSWRDVHKEVQSCK